MEPIVWALINRQSLQTQGGTLTLARQIRSDGGAGHKPRIGKPGYVARDYEPELLLGTNARKPLGPAAIRLRMQARYMDESDLSPVQTSFTLSDQIASKHGTQIHKWGLEAADLMSLTVRGLFTTAIQHEPSRGLQSQRKNRWENCLQSASVGECWRLLLVIV
jgi:hypothetical protein